MSRSSVRGPGDAAGTRKTWPLSLENIPEHSSKGDETIGKSHIEDVMTCCAKCHVGNLKGEGTEEGGGTCFRKVVQGT